MKKIKRTIAFIFLLLIVGIIVQGYESVKFIDNFGVEYGIDRIDNRPIFDSYSFYLDVSAGNVPGYELVHKFGSNDLLSSDWEVISTNGRYITPMTAEAVEILSSDVDDTFGGSGAYGVTILGLNENWTEQIVKVNLSGTTPVPIPKTFTRIYRAYVTESGTYANDTTGSHEGVITIRDLGGGKEWAIIDLLDGFPAGQTEIGAYTIPKGRTGYLLSKFMIVESNKPVDLALYHRANINDTTPPYHPMRLIEHHQQVVNQITLNPDSPLKKLEPLTDIGFLGKTQTSGTATVDFEILLIDNDIVDTTRWLR